MTKTQQFQPVTDHDVEDVVEQATQSKQQARPGARVAFTELHPAIDGWLERHSITLLRVSMGAVILGFGILKYFPGLSPAEPLIVALTDHVTFMQVPGRAAMVLTAAVECAIGLSLITGWGLRVIIYLVLAWALGILSPAVLLPDRMFSGPDHAPSLEGQYVLKDVILLTATLVIATTLRRRTSRKTTSQDRGAARYDNA